MRTDEARAREGGGTLRGKIDHTYLLLVLLLADLEQHEEMADEENGDGAGVHHTGRLHVNIADVPPSDRHQTEIN